MNIKQILPLSLLLCAGFAQGMEPAKISKQEEELREAAELGKYDQVKHYIDLGVKIHAKDSFRQTALSIACKNGHVDIVKLLLDNCTLAHPKDADVYSAALLRTILYSQQNLLHAIPLESAKKIIALLLNHKTKNFPSNLKDIREGTFLELLPFDVINYLTMHYHEQPAISISPEIKNSLKINHQKE